MKIYAHMSFGQFSNSYIVVNEKTNEALIIDPGKIRKEMITQLENNAYRPVAALITHSHPGHTDGLSALLKIYSMDIFAAESSIKGFETKMISGEGRLFLAGLEIHYFSVPGHAPDSLVYKIGSVLFTGDVICAGKTGRTSSNSSKMILRRGIEQKILTENEDTTIMPGHGPLTSVAAERMFNIDL